MNSFWRNSLQLKLLFVFNTGKIFWEETIVQTFVGSRFTVEIFSIKKSKQLHKEWIICQMLCYAKY